MNPRDEKDTRCKHYAMRRLTRAMQRLTHAQDGMERTMARRWVNAWSSAVGERSMRRIMPLPGTALTSSVPPRESTHLRRVS